MALAPDESGIWGGQKWHLHTEKLHFCGFQGEQRGRKGGVYRVFFLQNGCSGRGRLNNICIASYGVGAKFFTTNLMSVDLPQNTPKTRKPIAERTSHKWHGYTTRGCSVSAAPNNCYSSHGMHGTHRTFLQRKDSHRWHGSTQIVRCAVLPQNSQNTQNLTAWVWQGCHTLLICEHLCSSVGSSSLPEGSVRSAGISVLPRMPRIDTDS